MGETTIRQAQVDYGNLGAEAVLEAASALHKLRGQLDRADYPLVREIDNYLQDNGSAQQWRVAAFTEKFDEYAHEVARRCW
jgi:hypothetical protein